MYAKSPSYTVCKLILLGVKVYFNEKRGGTPGMDLFEKQYFTEQYIILTRTEEGHEKD